MKRILSRGTIFFLLLTFVLSGCGNTESIPKGSAGNAVGLFSSGNDSERDKGNEPVSGADTPESPEETPEETHIHSYTERIVAPGCETDGYTVHTCICGAEYVDAQASASGHRYEETAVAPGCDSQGYTLYRCACGKEYRGEYIPAAGHRCGEWNETKPPTTEEDGIMTRFCLNCGYKETKTVAKKTPEWTIGMAEAYAKDYIDNYGGGVFWDETLYYSDDGEGGGWRAPDAVYTSENWQQTKERIRTIIDDTVKTRFGESVLSGRVYVGIQVCFIHSSDDVWNMYIFEGVLSGTPVKKFP